MAAPKNIKVRTSQNYLPFLNMEDDFRVRFIDMTHTVVTNDSTWESHRQISFEIILIAKGKYRCSLDGTEISMSPWDMLIIQPGQQHEDYFCKGCTLFGFHFHLIPGNHEDFEPSIFDSDVKPAQQVIHLEEKSFFQFLIRNLLPQSRSPKNQFEYFFLHNAIFNVIFRKILLLYPQNVLYKKITRKLALFILETVLTSFFNHI